MTDATQALAQVREALAALRGDWLGDGFTKLHRGEIIGVLDAQDGELSALKHDIAEYIRNTAEQAAEIVAQAAEIERLTAENEKLRRLLSEWLRENSPGGWIDELRRQLADAIRERDELRGLIDAHNADCIARCEAMSTQAGHAGVCSHYTNRGRTCPNCPRDEMIAQADAALGLTRPAEE